MKKIKRKDKKYWKNKLVKVFEYYIRLRDNWECFTCNIRIPNNKTLMHAGHLLSRRYERTQFDEENVFCQCRTCNFTHSHAPQNYFNLYVHRFGPQQLNELVNRARGVSGYNAIWMEEKCKEYEQKVKELENGMGNKGGGEQVSPIQGWKEALDNRPTIT